MSINIPSIYLDGFSILGEKINVAKAKKIALEVSKLDSKPSESDLTEILKHIVKLSNDDSEKLSSAISSIFDLMHALKQTSELVAKELARGYKESRVYDENVDLKTFEVVLEIILSSSVKFNEYYKAVSLREDNNRNLINSKIISDVRYLFKKSLSEKPDTAVIVHNLKLTYYDNEEKKVFISLDSNDLISFKKTIDRAIEKEKTLINLLEENGSKIILPSKDE